MKIRELKTILEALDDEDEIEIYHIPRKDYDYIKDSEFSWEKPGSG